MSPKLLIGIGAVTLLMPVVLTWVLLDLTLRYFVILVSIAALILLTYVFRSFWLIKAFVYAASQPTIDVFFILTSVSAIILVFSLRKLRHSRACHNLEWQKEPSLPDLAHSCNAYLFRNGWSYHNKLVLMDSFIMQIHDPSSKSKTFIFCHNGVRLGNIKKELAQKRWGFGPGIIVVTWKTALDHVLNDAKAFGWTMLTATELKKTFYSGRP